MPAILSTLRATLGDVEFNTRDDDGVTWGLEKLSGWGSPASTLSLTQKPRDHGAWGDGPAYLTPRVLAASGTIEAPTPALAWQAHDRLCRAVALDPVRLTVHEAERDRWCMVQRDDEVIPDWITDRAFEWSAQLVAKDPRKYGDPITATVGLPSSSGGLTWPVAWPIRWDASTTSGVLHIYNPGDIPVPVKMRIDSGALPLDGPFIRHDGAGVELVLSSAYTLGAGSWLDVDTGRKWVLEGGTASRNGWIVKRGWFRLDPGPNDFIFGNAGAYTAAASLTLTATPAWQ
ncbi:MAG TPA: hypothetical protein VFL65_00870 [Jatrophihabitans sp.]|nr:hypothetical protein [Jatrophihabitans sp.]